MLTEDKVTVLFFMTDEFCKFFDRLTKKYTIKDLSKSKYHHDGTLSKAEVMLIMILFMVATYCCFPKKATIQDVKYSDNRLTLF